jgi:hypothetical protein
MKKVDGQKLHKGGKTSSQLKRFVTRLKGSNKISRSQDRPWKQIDQEATWVEETNINREVRATALEN